MAAPHQSAPDSDRWATGDTTSPGGEVPGATARTSDASRPPTPLERRIGGQAVVEGVMMRGRDRWAVAARDPGGTIRLMVAPLPKWSHHGRGVPWWRGLLAVAETMALGVRAVRWSAAISEGRPEPDRRGAALRLAATVAVVIAAFVLLPAAVGRLVVGEQGNPWLANAVEGSTRLAVFLGYLVLIGLAPSIRRVFQYHGAEHKVIAAYEAHRPPLVAVAQLESTRHARCGTDFVLLLVVLTILLQAMVPATSALAIVVTRLVVLVVVAGAAYELIRLAGRARVGALRVLIAGPGLALQRLTTREPDDDQVEVALAALEAVTDPVDARPQST